MSSQIVSVTTNFLNFFFQVYLIKVVAKELNTGKGDVFLNMYKLETLDN